MEWHCFAASVGDGFLVLLIEHNNRDLLDWYRLTRAQKRTWQITKIFGPMRSHGEKIDSQI